MHCSFSLTSQVQKIQLNSETQKSTANWLRHYKKWAFARKQVESLENYEVGALEGFSASFCSCFRNFSNIVNLELCDYATMRKGTRKVFLFWDNTRDLPQNWTTCHSITCSNLSLCLHCFYKKLFITGCWVKKTLFQVSVQYSELFCSQWQTC